MAPGLALLPDAAGYRLYVESLFDEFSTEIKVLFDRRDAASVLWPKRQTFEALLTILNATELSGVWGEDETIGWVYQFFNSGEERKKMRDESQAPRNSRELAVRNQFFTPRYVVQFLIDNTLGRLWLEMHGGTDVVSPSSATISCDRLTSRLGCARERTHEIFEFWIPRAAQGTSCSTALTFARDLRGGLGASGAGSTSARRPDVLCARTTRTSPTCAGRRRDSSSNTIFMASTSTHAARRSRLWRFGCGRNGLGRISALPHRSGHASSGRTSSWRSRCPAMLRWSMSLPRGSIRRCFATCLGRWSARAI